MKKKYKKKYKIKKMNDYFCKNCNNIIGQFDEDPYYDNAISCYYITSKNDKYITFLDCVYCDKFVGILCVNVCENCFGEDVIVMEEKIFNWFQIYRKLKHGNFCIICNKNKFRFQYWFLNELTFYKKKRLNIRRTNNDV